ncbi:hypothetical protein P8452_41600 [Trifolium repens]|nr:hypothetical protein P8452_41600 [Trifolium repens]
MTKIEAASLPSLHSPGYYTEPSLKELASREALYPGYCSGVPDFTVGRFGYGYVKYLNKTDVRGLCLDDIVKFHRHVVVVYEDENDKPAVGQGLNKEAEVVLVLDKCRGDDVLVKKLKQSTERQGARFISFDPVTCEWKFLVDHFSRFGFDDDDDDDDEEDAVIMDDVEKESPTNNIDEIELSHSLPAHLRLDPVKMREMRSLMFPYEEEEMEEDLGHKSSFGSKDHVRPLKSSAQFTTNRSTPPVV